MQAGATTATPSPSAASLGPLAASSTEHAPSPALAPPPGNPRFALFDGLRGVAVFGILAFHVLEFTGQIGRGVVGRFAEVAGFQALITFFVISGFLLYRPYVAARASGRRVPSTARYARRRALRILPVYWTVLTLLAIYPGLQGVFSGDWWRYYGYLQTYSSRTEIQGIPVAWSLCVEMTFYIALPLWAMSVRRLPGGRVPRRLFRAEMLPLTLVLLGGSLIQVLAARRLVSDVFRVALTGQISWIAIGMMLAVASVAAQQDAAMCPRLRKLAEFPGLCWGLAAAALAGLMVLMPGTGLFGLIAGLEFHQPTPTTVAILALRGVVVVLMVLPAVFAGPRPGFPRRLLGARPIAWLGVISYSFYLWHLAILELIASPRTPTGTTGLNLLGHLHTARGLVLYVLTFSVTVLVATISYRTVELPFLRRKESARRATRDDQLKAV
jgi:peptidoglycan/LPS O-acetylase OafA/YrhL